MNLSLDTFLESTRLRKPVGIWLLFWPCAWGLALAKAPWSYYALFFCGALFLRSAGCIINDYFDKDFDQKVERTKNRPFATGRLNFNEALIYLAILLSGGLVVLSFLPMRAWAASFAVFPLVIIYPLLKRFSNLPQVLLGLIFNIGVIIAWLSFFPEVGKNVVFLYLAGVFWTIGYDTIYGFQDIDDDLKIGVKSTSILAQKYPSFIILCLYSAVIFLLSLNVKFSFLSLFMMGCISFLLFKQVFIDFKNKQQLWNAFFLNTWVGGLITVMLILQRF